jgi:hypothetical protein
VVGEEIYPVVAGVWDGEQMLILRSGRTEGSFCLRGRPQGTDSRRVDKHREGKKARIGAGNSTRL